MERRREGICTLNVEPEYCISAKILVHTCSRNSRCCSACSTRRLVEARREGLANLPSIPGSRQPVFLLPLAGRAALGAATAAAEGPAALFDAAATFAALAALAPGACRVFFLGKVTKKRRKSAVCSDLSLQVITPRFTLKSVSYG